MEINVRTDPALAAENAKLRARLVEIEDELRTVQRREYRPVAEGQPGLDAASTPFFGEMFGEINQAVIAIDESDRVTYLNEAAERQYGVGASEALGQPISAVYAIRWIDPADEARGVAKPSMSGMMAANWRLNHPSPRCCSPARRSV
ncbi:PAS domain-containing protein [Bradyrhizobium sp.]|uniref:PAS domain-containing protein n=1 Tax=Bradyrhizobium sp. TaxID=376 RepID=UPI0025C41551|nr:PAS domain-containing protein [Bradyrhizobium sp.]